MKKEKIKIKALDFKGTFQQMKYKFLKNVCLFYYYHSKVCCPFSKALYKLKEVFFFSISVKQQTKAHLGLCQFGTLQWFCELVMAS